MSSPKPHDEGGFAGPVPRLSQPAAADDCVKILLATDNHVGYAETDPVRGRDSINSFREILELAVANDVDMLLLAGDLFHENRPSRTSLYQVMTALREFTHGPRPISLRIVSDAGIGIAREASWPSINYEDENINVGLPVFSIHGNHDDPQGTGSEGALCALDLLSASGLINYFGRTDLPGSTETDDEALDQGLKVKPILLQKGTTKLALYGMGNVRDERFHFEMMNSRVELFQPAEDPDDWFNVMLVHQNRVPHGAKPNNTVDTAFPDEAHLIVWGHEHDCIQRATPVPVSGRPYYIVQPGSSIATSLAKGESIPKHVSLIKIQGKEFEFEPIRLRSVRPFIFEDISLAEAHDPAKKVNLKDKVAVSRYLKARVNGLVERANAEWDALHPDLDESERLLPLIRIRVDYSGGPDGNGSFEIGNPQRFGQDFVDRVANPRDIVFFHRKASRGAKKVVMDGVDQEEAMAAIEQNEDIGDKLEKLRVSSLVAQYLSAQNLGVLAEEYVQEAIEEYVEKGDRDAISHMLKKSVKLAVAEISKDYKPSKEGPEHDDLHEEARAVKEKLSARFVSKDKGKKGKAREEESSASSEEGEDDDEDDQDSMDSGVTRSSAGRGKKKTAATKKKAELFLTDEEDEDVSDVSPPPPKRAPIKKAAPALTTKKAAAVKPKPVPIAKAKPARQAAAKATAKTQQVVLTDSEDDSDEAPSRKRRR